MYCQFIDLQFVDKQISEVKGCCPRLVPCGVVNMVLCPLSYPAGVVTAADAAEAKATVMTALEYVMSNGGAEYSVSEDSLRRGVSSSSDVGEAGTGLRVEVSIAASSCLGVVLVLYIVHQ